MRWPWVRRRTAVAAVAVSLCNAKPLDHSPARGERSMDDCCGTCLAEARRAVDDFAGRWVWGW
jgi:hypothetical protein